MKKQRATISRSNVENLELVSVSVDESHKEQGKHKALKYLLRQKNPTVDLTATSNYDHKSVHTDDYEKMVYQYGT